MNNKNGFTLIELLIAAVIIGTLAIFATQSFRSTSSDIRLEDAKARAKIVAMAARRFWSDHPSVGTVDTNAVTYQLLPLNPNINQCDETTISIQNLIYCGYLEYRQYVHDTRDAAGAARNNFTMYFDVVRNNGTMTDIRVCVTGNNPKIVDSGTRRYCTNGETESSEAVPQN